ncbi:hypothetical protein G8A07_13580 [Roseateles sp. DAIF2]|uniref:PilW family protein n=1 Tax=Roseateles sp. DAIF2 TaxID=2714952 RepID=UPI0018A2A652|nr:hypothetical protein [Roseateles sp. DAIF2]QPF73847.1 hypothetical protein G8A07_13580 [Roseateles sp. DAIF2]
MRGLGLVELMVGLTVGLIVVAGASVMMVGQIGEHRRLMLETQIQQDLRAAADLMLRDLRRAGYRGRAEEAVWASGASATTANPYAQVLSVAREGGEVNYSYSSARPDRVTTENNQVDANERFGYRLQTGVLQFNQGGTWQPLTDPQTLKVTDFQVRINTQDLSLEEFCLQPCPAAAADCPPRQLVRDVSLRIEGQAAHDKAVVRSVNLSARLRNDAIEGSCGT